MFLGLSGRYGEYSKDYRCFCKHSLDLAKYGVKEVAAEGRPSYNPKGMYKLYIYGNRKEICSSRKLVVSCKVNLEVKC